MEGQQPETVVNVFNYQLTWNIENIYMYKEILDTTIAGPEFGGKLLSFPWTLRLGQSQYADEVKGISLIIQRNNVPRGDGVLVNFWVCISRHVNPKLLMNNKFRAPFGYQSTWESPTLVTNDAFRREAASYEIHEGWKIEVQLMWNENVGFESAMNTGPSFYNLFAQVRKVGLDLKKFCNSDWLCDVYIGSGDAKIPVHWPILASRCPYLANQLEAYSDQRQELDDSFISFCNPEVIEAFLVYLYTGDIYSVTERGPLPLGIDTLAQRTGVALHEITRPLFFGGRTSVELESIVYDWTIDGGQILTAIDESAVSIDSELFGHREIFSLHVAITNVQDNSLPSISVFLMVRRMENYDRIYAMADLSAKCSDEGVVSQKREFGDFLPGSWLHFQRVLNLNVADRQNLQLLLRCEIRFSREGLRTYATAIPDECGVESDRALPDFDFARACSGWNSMRVSMLELFNGNHSDCMIVVQDGKLAAHRVVLAARSRYFFQVISRKEDEQKGSSFGMEIHLLNDIAINAFVMKVILEILYTGSNEISDERLIEIIHFPAKFFGLGDLKHHGRTIF